MLRPMIISMRQQTTAKIITVAHALPMNQSQKPKTSLSLIGGLAMNPLPALTFSTPMSLRNGQLSSQMERRMSPESECFKTIMVVTSLAQQFQSPGPNAERLLLMPLELGASLSVQRVPKPVRFRWLEIIGLL